MRWALSSYDLCSAEQRARALRKLPSLGQGDVCVLKAGVMKLLGEWRNPREGTKTPPPLFPVNWKEWLVVSESRLCLRRDSVATKQHGLKKATTPAVKAGQKGPGTLLRMSCVFPSELKTTSIAAR